MKNRKVIIAVTLGVAAGLFLGGWLMNWTRPIPFAKPDPGAAPGPAATGPGNQWMWGMMGGPGQMGRWMASPQMRDTMISVMRTPEMRQAMVDWMQSTAMRDTMVQAMQDPQARDSVVAMLTSPAMRPVMVQALKTTTGREIIKAAADESP